MTDLGIEQIGPAIAGRLQGRPYNMAMSLRITNRAGVVMVADEALAYPGEAVALDGLGNVIALQSRAARSNSPECCLVAMAPTINSSLPARLTSLRTCAVAG